MKRVLIVGAGGFGRELYFWLLQHAAAGVDWSIAGFLDDNLAALDGYDFPARVVSGVETYQTREDDLLVCALGQPKTKEKVCQQLKIRGGRFMTFIHPSVVIGGQTTFGEGVVLCPGVILTSCIELGDLVMFNCHASAGHDVRVGSYSTLSGHCDLTGHCTVGRGVFMGSRASLIPGVAVGNGSVVGAGAVVIRSVPPGVTVFGNPAKVLPV